MVCKIPRGLVLVQRQGCELVNELLDSSADLKNLMKSKQNEKVGESFPPQKQTLLLVLTTFCLSI